MDRRSFLKRAPDQVEKILGRNLYRLYQEVIG